MNLIAVTYYNIGPFEKKLITINFKKGKFLIKAPIGTGKSFLFFDGPLFGLYKYSSRETVLNNKSFEGFIKLIFEVNDELFLIERQIKATKTGGQSVNSRFYKLSLQSFDLPDKIIIYDFDIQNLLKDSLEEINFKSQVDLQQTLESLIGPKEVFINTNFLLQESDNIFELTPSQRIDVFKNIFGLLNIDTSKDIIAEEKKTIQTTLKIKSDTANFDQKLKDAINQIFEIKKTLLDICNKDNRFEHIKVFFGQQTFEDLNLIKDNININMFNFQLSLEPLNSIQKLIEDEKEKYQSLKGQYDIIQKNYLENDLRIQNLQNQKKQKISQKQTIEKTISEFDQEKLNNLKSLKQTTLQKQNETLYVVDFEKIKEFGRTPKDIWEANSLIDELTNQGKSLKINIQNIQNQIDFASSDLQNKLQNIDLQIANLNKQAQQFQEAIENTKQKLDKISSSLVAETTFFCQKISADCPFVQQINKVGIKMINDQKLAFENDYNQLLEKLKAQDIENQIKNLQTEKEKLINKKQTDIQELEKQKLDLQKSLDDIKKFFENVNRKAIKQAFEDYKKFEQEIKKLDSDITNLELNMSKINEYKQQLAGIENDIKNIDENIKDIQNQLNQNQIQLENLKDSIKSINIDLLQNIQKQIGLLNRYIETIFDIIKEYKDNQIQIKKLKQDEKILTQLYQIFSKELMLIVLQDFLPSLEDVINNLLAQVVDYEIKLEIINKTSDKLELDIKIIDSKGTRSPKSLSGGQKTILKLVWMLAISSMLKVKFLFLDETINNLDEEAVSRVSKLIEDFVSSNDIKFYVVTHNIQIQQMNIWDLVVEVGSV